MDPLPINCYHKTKLEAEKIIISKLPNSLVLRVGWLFGSISSGGKDFVKSRIEEMLTLSIIDKYYANPDQYGNPTASQFVKECICLLLEKNAYGVFNCVNNGAVSRFQFVEKIKEICEFDFILLPKSSNFFKRSARVPVNETGCTLKLQSFMNSSHWEPYLESHCTSFLNNRRDLKL